MGTRQIRIFPLLITLLLSIEICGLIDFLLVLFSVTVRLRVFLILWALLFAMLVFLNNRCGVLHSLLAVVTALLVLAGLVVLLVHCFFNGKYVSEKLVYADVETDKEQLFAGKKVMLLVPHEDDDLNLLGGALENYLRYGSDFYLVFLTNGDYDGEGEVRISEALSLYDFLGLAEDHVFFLGYGDRIGTPQYHLYNAPENEVIASHIGKTATYGNASHPAYRENRPYTRGNIFQDVKEVILEVRPDLIYCVDYDMHLDHKACSLIFESVMGEILKSMPDYTPEVQKGFAYSTAWDAEMDYFRTNIKSTQNAYSSPAGQFPAIYRWEERIRIPVQPCSLSRSLAGSSLYRELEYYASQKTTKRAVSIINGDKVFWRRATDSLCRNAVITASSGDAWRLNDFKLLDTEHLQDLSYPPFDGVWIPEECDQDKTAFVQLASQESVYEVVLYDNPSTEDNILNAAICFDDGTIFETGPLDPTGAATRFYPDKTAVQSIQISILDTEGNNAGITEVEAFAAPAPDIPSFIKLMDGDGDFVYDYWTEPDGMAIFSLYSDGVIPDLTADEYSVQCDEESCRAVIKEGKIVVFCPEEKRCTVTVTWNAGGRSDAVVVQSPNRVMRMELALCQKIEMFLLKDHQQLFCMRVLEAIRYSTELS